MLIEYSVDNIFLNIREKLYKVDYIAVKKGRDREINFLLKQMRVRMPQYIIEETENFTLEARHQYVSFKPKKVTCDRHFRDKDPTMYIAINMELNSPGSVQDLISFAFQDTVKEIPKKVRKLPVKKDKTSPYKEISF